MRVSAEAEAIMGVRLWCCLDEDSSESVGTEGGGSQMTFRTELLCPSNVKRHVYVDRDQTLTVRSPEPETSSPREELDPPSARLMGGVPAGENLTDQTPRL